MKHLMGITGTKHVIQWWLELRRSVGAPWGLKLQSRLAMLIGKPVIRFTSFKPVTGLQNVLPVTEFIY